MAAAGQRRHADTMSDTPIEQPSAAIAESLRSDRCVPCEGGIPKLTAEEARDQLAGLTDWTLSDDATQIERRWTCRNFASALSLLNTAGDIAETDDHHPDLHLTGYRHVRIVLTTHAINGLSRNDFIVAAKIDAAAGKV